MAEKSSRGGNSTGDTQKDARKQRLADELRKNLLRRKAQARQRSSVARAGAVEQAGDPENNSSEDK